MKKPSMCTIIGSSGRDCLLIILFQIYGTKDEEGNLFWVGQYDHPTHPHPPKPSYQKN